jgi:hypothetical protein
VNVADKQEAVKQCDKKMATLQETIAFGFRIQAASIDRDTAQPTPSDYSFLRTVGLGQQLLPWIS